MLTAQDLHGEQTGVEWTARPLRPVARWTAQRDGTGRPRLRMTWSVPEVTPGAVTATASDGTRSAA